MKNLALLLAVVVTAVFSTSFAEVKVKEPVTSTNGTSLQCLQDKIGTTECAITVTVD